MTNQFWVRHKEHAWVARTLDKKGDKTVTFKAEDGEAALEVSLKEFDDLCEVQEEHFKGIDDICNLTAVSEGALLSTVKKRYLQDLIYTRVARTVISVNPYKSLPIYDTGYSDKYKVCQDSMELEPHIYGLAQDALNALMQAAQMGKKAHQAVLISGESGAGKSEAAKCILGYVGDAVGSVSSDGGLEAKVLQANQVLEAFGNAMTVRNNNSSRFGKWIDLRFSEKASKFSLLGCSITSYLLETTRICQQAPKEACYHMFLILHLAKKAKIPEIVALDLKDAKQYRYMNQGRLDKDPPVSYEEFQGGLNALDMGEDARPGSPPLSQDQLDERKETRRQIFAITAGVLELGNCEFKDGQEHDSSEIKDPKQAGRAAKLFGLDEQQLTDCMNKQILNLPGGGTAEKFNKPAQAAFSRDAMAQFIYEKLFLWLITRMNNVLVLSDEDIEPNEDAESLLGILDIAGFESFEVNSLEQLQINLSNEHLQQHFNNVIFKAELEESAAEGVPVPQNVGFVDNKKVLDLIDAKGGILDILDEVMAIQANTDQTYADKVKKDVKSEQLIVPKAKGLTFGIRHFAGEVHYNLDGWIDKNAKKVPDLLGPMLKQSSLHVLQDLMQLAEDDAFRQLNDPVQTRRSSIATDPKIPQGGSRPRAGSTSGKKRSVTRNFRTSLQGLIFKIEQRQSHFVRCVKPNKEKKALLLEGAMTMEQLLFSGVLATVQIRQQGFAYRIPHKDFEDKYHLVIRQECGDRKKLKEFVEKLSDVINKRKPEKAVTADMMAMGKSKVFMKTQVYRALEKLYQQAMWKLVTYVQKMWKGAKAKRETGVKLDIVRTIRDVQRKFRLEELATPPDATKCPSSGRPMLGRRRTRSSVWGEESIAARVPEAEWDQVVGQLEKNLGEGQRKGIPDRNVDIVLAKRTLNRMKDEKEAMDEVKGLLGSKDELSMDKAIAKASALSIPLEGNLAQLMKEVELIKNPPLEPEPVEEKQAEEEAEEEAEAEEEEEQDDAQHVSKALSEREFCQGKVQDARAIFENQGKKAVSAINRAKDKLLRGGEEASRKRKASIGILGGQKFSQETQSLVETVGHMMSSELGPEAAFLTGGLPGVQQTFAESCKQDTLLYNLLADDNPGSNYKLGTDKFLDSKLGQGAEEEVPALNLLADIYIVAEGEGPEMECAVASAIARGAIVVPLFRTFGNTNNSMLAAVKKPPFVDQSDWDMLGSHTCSMQDTASAVVRIAKATIDSRQADNIRVRDDRLVPCTACGEMLVYSDFREGKYATQGWRCANCPSISEKQEGKWRWFCRSCSRDICRGCYSKQGKAQSIPSGVELLMSLDQAAKDYNEDALDELIRKCEVRGMSAKRTTPDPEGELDDESDAGSQEPEESDNEDATQKMPTEIIEYAKKRLLMLQKPEFLEKAVNDERERLATESQEQGPTKEQKKQALQRLECLARVLEKRGGQQELAEQARQAHQEGLATVGNGRSAFETEDDEELDMAINTFQNFAMYCRLRPEWKTRRSEANLSQLRYSKDPIRNSLTYPPEGIDEELYKDLSIRNYKNVLVSMEDRPRAQLQRQACTQAVRELMIQCPALQGECYMQVLKQLHFNPKKRSAKLGWELLLGMCIECPPQKEVGEFVRGFLTQGEGRPERLIYSGSGVVSLARACLTHLCQEVEAEGELPPQAADRTQRPRASTAWEAATGNFTVFNVPSDVQKIGFSLHYIPKRPPVVKKVTPGTWAYRHGIRSGDVIVQLNKEDCKNFDESYFTEEMRRRPLSFAIDMELSVRGGGAGAGGGHLPESPKSRSSIPGRQLPPSAQYYGDAKPGSPPRSPRAAPLRRGSFNPPGGYDQRQSIGSPCASSAPLGRQVRNVYAHR